tara:strand:+ start:423 stop:983 length:561 start_codon:yes stop_codon:yes gene_type:complete
MRIIGGNFKGKKISIPSDIKTRPLRDMVKESIFNLIQHSNKINFNLQNSIILDLFSGTGSFGLECISRGSKHVVFIENYDQVLKILKNNVKNLKLVNNYEILENDCFKIFNFNKKFEHKFDLIFIDPPFKERRLNLLIEKIKEKKILKKDGILVIHRHKKDKEEITKKIKILDQRTYGISKILMGI